MTEGRLVDVDAPLRPRDDDHWWKRAVVYQVYPRSFADSNGDGIGDINGITGRLDYLQRLGVDALWLSPIYSSPQADNGYDISDYRAVDPLYGTLDDFDDLLSEAHRRDIRLIMDLVVNHTSDQHPWFLDSARSTDAGRRDWYWWRPPRHANGDRPEPTNWQSFFSGPTWTVDEGTGEYYLHLFTPNQPDLNWENPDVRHAVYDMMGWWLDRGVDGFRMDVINLISKDPRLPDGHMRPGARYGDGFPHFANGPRLHEYLAEMGQQVFAPRDRTYLTVGEMPGVDMDTARQATDPARRELDMVFQFEHVECDYQSGNKWVRTDPPQERLIDSLTRWQEGLAEVGWNSLYLGNHDHPRSLSRFGDPERHWYRSGSALALMLHGLSGTPYVYQGDELGMVNADFTSLDQIRDVEARNHFAERVREGVDSDAAWNEVLVACRDHARTPMHWSAATGSFTTGTPWIRGPMAVETPTAVEQIDDPNSMFSWYRRLIELRHNERTIVEGDFQRLRNAAPPEVFAYTRTLGDDTLLVIANLSGSTVQLDLAELDSRGLRPADLLISNTDDPTLLEHGRVAPWAAGIWRR